MNLYDRGTSTTLHLGTEINEPSTISSSESFCDALQTPEHVQALFNVLSEAARHPSGIRATVNFVACLPRKSGPGQSRRKQSKPVHISRTSKDDSLLVVSLNMDGYVLIYEVRFE